MIFNLLKYKVFNHILIFFMSHIFVLLLFCVQTYLGIKLIVDKIVWLFLDNNKKDSCSHSRLYKVFDIATLWRVDQLSVIFTSQFCPNKLVPGLLTTILGRTRTCDSYSTWTSIGPYKDKFSPAWMWSGFLQKPRADFHFYFPIMYFENYN